MIAYGGTDNFGDEAVFRSPESKSRGVDERVRADGALEYAADSAGRTGCADEATKDKVMADDNMLISAMPFCMKRYRFVKTTAAIGVGSDSTQSGGAVPYDCNQQWNMVSKQLVSALGL